MRLRKDDVGHEETEAAGANSQVKFNGLCKNSLDLLQKNSNMDVAGIKEKRSKTVK